jgi:hypothetical protein
LNVLALGLKPCPNALGNAEPEFPGVEFDGEWARQIGAERHQEAGRLLMDAYSNDVW